MADRGAVWTVAAYAWKAPLVAIAYVLGAGTGGALAVALGLKLPALPEGADPQRLQTFGALAALTFAAGLGPLARMLRGGLVARWLVLSLFFYVCAGPNTALESAIFSDLAGGGAISVIFVPAALLCGAALALLFPPAEPGGSLGEALRGLCTARGPGAWAWRLVAAWLAFPLIYTAFGMCVGPFVMDYYEQGQFALALPGWGTILPVQLLRSALFLVAALPVVAAWSGTRTQLALRLGLALFVMVGLFGMIQAVWMPPYLRLLHGTEILADSMVHAAALAVLLLPGEQGRTARASRPAA
jgi:hypothetical protein